MNPDDMVKVKLDQQGRVLIPADIREKMRLEPGKQVSMYLDEGGLHVVSSHIAWQRIQRLVAETVPEGVSLADKLIAERRAEAVREDRE